MNAPSRSPELFIVADRGMLRIFEVEPTERGPALRSRENLRIEEGRGRFQDEFTDQAGAFPNAGTNGQGNSIAERQSLTAEDEARSFRRIAGRIQEVVRETGARRWSFAAPPEINGAILDGLPGEVKRSLFRNVPKDLVNVPAPDLLGHFARG